MSKDKIEPVEFSMAMMNASLRRDATRAAMDAGILPSSFRRYKRALEAEYAWYAFFEVGFMCRDGIPADEILRRISARYSKKIPDIEKIVDGIIKEWQTDPVEFGQKSASEKEKREAMKELRSK